LAVSVPVKLQTSFSLQFRGTGPEFFTGLSLRNPGTSDAHLSAYFALDDGSTAASTTLVLPKGVQQITTLADVLPEAAGNGYVVAQSDIPIELVGMDGRSDNSALAMRLPQYVSASLTPQPQRSFSIAGTVRDPHTGVNGQNIGVPDIALELTGAGIDT